ncbi:hypothetical protein G7Z17_g8091 [Cylindrodendrum hubeiense]|uniref:Heterokaryon incompatibility domain-containing protein n=1 Tax=Cylindrodendrum hubeiense TaxID=595255 RepID=A0A9P5HA91_9HYPO|nr:hypothetical protein G7Z17_g8091 [Cylindrodendrum hubeiense]
MRLLNTETIELKQFGDDEIPPYAILSHTWLEDEILFQDIGQAYAPNKKGYRKTVDFCAKAQANGFEYVWIDTCCIDKTSSAELSEAINSMYHWYEKSTVCYAYLADVSSLFQVSKSRWFTRGWTLQELIAPSHMIFFDKAWEELGTKKSLGDIISDSTGIPPGILSGEEHFETASIAQRMSWAANRGCMTESQARLKTRLGQVMLDEHLKDELVLAVERGREAAAEQLLTLYNTQDDWQQKGQGGVLLSLAAAAGSGKVEPDMKDLKGLSALWYAAKNGHEAVMKLLFETGWVDIETKDEFNATALWHAAALGNDRVVRLLLENRATVSHKAKSNRTALCQASTRGYTTIVEYLLNSNADFEARDIYQGTPLWYAAVGGHEATVKVLLDKGAAAEVVRANEILSPLWHACSKGYAAIVRMLLCKGAHIVDQSSNCVVGLEIAAEHGHSAVVEALLEASGDTTAAVKTIAMKRDRRVSPAIYDNDLLLIATMGGHEDILKMLLEKGADVNQLWKGSIILTYAIQTIRGCGAIADALLEVPRDGWKSHNVTKYLLDEDKSGNYPGGVKGHAWCLARADYCKVDALWCAAIQGHAACVEVLLKHGASTLTSTGVPQHALVHAKRQGYGDIFQLLRNR